MTSEKPASTQHAQQWCLIFTFLFVFLFALIFLSAGLLLFFKVNHLILFLSWLNFQIFNIRNQFILIKSWTIDGLFFD
jgi:membrane protein insertase Oxa1/YidC/SpoIIIJ